MKLITTLNSKRFELDLEHPISLAIPVKFNGEQPNHFGAPIASKKPLASNGFIGDTQQGGSCNVDHIQMVPHCNGTHTESIHHVTNTAITIGKIHSNSLTHALLASVSPKNATETKDSYTPDLESSDWIIDLQELQRKISKKNLGLTESLIIRTLPNHPHKISVIYDDESQPPFFSQEAIQWLAASSIKHLLVDIPSLDKMYDNGHLINHRCYWNLETDSHELNDQAHLDRTVTEMIYVPDNAADGFYALNLQVPAFELDAAPSRPLLYPLKPLNND